MTNYQELFKRQMDNPEFAKAYHEARLERVISEMLTALKDKIVHDEPKENLLYMIDSIQHTVEVTLFREIV
ncbi:MAG: hypothetical protein HQK70_07755 [Desulfamplus sp.]|nr:hypothetical protein [Desulfamplus sp.]